MAENIFSYWQKYLNDFSNEPVVSFMTLWMCYNSYYNKFHNQTERQRACELSKNKNAIKIYEEHKIEILKLFMNIPYKNYSVRTFVENLSNRYNAEYNENKCDLKDFLNVVYQIRCNLLHGQKNPSNDIDMSLVKWAYSSLYQILHKFNNRLF